MDLASHVQAGEPGVMWAMHAVTEPMVLGNRVGCSTSVHPPQRGVATSDDDGRVDDPDRARSEAASEVRCPIDRPTYSQLRLMGAARARLLHRTASCVDDADDVRAQRIASRLRSCCRAPVVVVGSCGTTLLSVARCKHRLCPQCSAMRARDAAARMERAIQRMDSPRMLTLTIRSDGEDLAVLLGRLRDAFRRLRQRRSWRDHVTAGIYAIECTYREHGGGWHPHVHVVIDGRFWAHAQIKAEWAACTTDSSVVDIRAIRSKRAAARYVAKYVAKGIESERWPAWAVSEYAATMAGARLIHTVGALHGVTLDEDTDERVPVQSPRTVGLGYLAALASRGSGRVARLLTRLRECGGLWRRAVGTGWCLPGDRRARPPADRATRIRRLGALAARIASRDQAGLGVDRRRREYVEVTHDWQMTIPSWLDRPPPLR